MDHNNEITVMAPRYQKIAVDIASKIVDGTYQLNEKIYARSTLASQYGVSSETARRAICVLSDLKIVSSEKGSGVTILSYEAAVKYVKQFTEIATIHDIKNSILKSVERQKNEIEIFKSYLDELVIKTEKLRSDNPFIPFQITIEENATIVNQSVGQANFWQNTSGTIIAIRRGKNILLSPGPYATFKKEDIVFFIGDSLCFDRVNKFIYPQD